MTKKSNTFLFSLTFVLAFCRLAAAEGIPAPTPVFADPAHALGTYQVTAVLSNIKGNNKLIDLCAPGAETDSSNAAMIRDCGKYAWVVRSENQVALLQAPETFAEDTPVASMFLAGMFIHRKCQEVMGQKQALNGGLFNSGFCRAYSKGPAKKLALGATEKFFFGSQVPELKKLPTTYTFLDILAAAQLSGAGSGYTIEIPYGNPNPSTIKLVQEIKGMIVGVPAKIQYTTILTLVANREE